ncbi:MAG: bifunctional glycosyltransferase/class I SAM-dependent methyltransferase [Ilumatobacteraceae bacterium]
MTSLLLPKSCVVVLPTRNEADAITAVLSEVHEGTGVLDLIGCSTRVLLVDDGSVDGTVEMARDFAASVGLGLEVQEGPGDGLGAAVLAGMRSALADDPDVIVCLDADGQHDARDIPTLIRAHFARKSDITIGSRWTRGGRSPGTSLFRSTGSKVGNGVFRLVTGTREVTDATTAFRVYSPRVARFLVDSKVGEYRGYAFFSGCIALAEAAGYVIDEVPITFRPRYGGASKLTPAEVRRFFKTLSQMRRDRRLLPPNVGDEYLASAELDLLSEARHWQELLVGTATQAVTETPELVVEVGAGRGAVVAEIRRRYPAARIIAVEPDARNYAELVRTVAGLGIETERGTIGTLAERDDVAAQTDLVAYVNVLEHIDDDLGELTAAAGLLRPGGTLFVAVPALQGIYGPVDARSGHFRRYDAVGLRRLFIEAGLEVVDASYVDPIGIVPYWLYFRVLNRASFSTGSVKVFDRAYVPVIRALRTGPLSKLPGKTVVCVGRKS